MQAIVYTSPNCHYCTKLKQYLTEQSISYEERNIAHNEAYAAQLEKLGVMSVPVTVIGETVVLGLNAPRIQKALAAVQEGVVQ